MGKEKTFAVTAEVTISLYKEIVAADAQDALRQAERLELPSLCWQCAGSREDDVWDLLGELDGEPQNVKIDE